MYVKFDDFKLRGISDRLIVQKVRFGMLSGSFGNFISRSGTLGQIPEKSDWEAFHSHFADVKPDGTGIFEKRFTSWGTSCIPITVFLTKKTGLPEEKRKVELKHQVSFIGKGKWSQFSIRIDKEVARKLGIKDK